MNKHKLKKRVLFHKIEKKELVDVPNLIEVQVNSFKRFIEEGIKEELKSISPVVGYGGKYELEFLENYVLEEPSVSYADCVKREVTYSAPLRVPVRLINKETGEIKEQDVFMSDIPMMTDQGTFLINGAERIVVSQFIRSPGIYFRKKVGTSKNKITFLSTVIPNRGSWLEIEADSNNIIYAHINKLRKVHITVLLGALGYTEKDILDKCSDKVILLKTLEKAPIVSKEECLI